MKKFSAILFILCFLTGCSSDMMDESKSSNAKKVNQGTSYSNEKIEWGFKKVKESAPEVPADWIELLDTYNGVYLGDTEKKVLYLTFDEGYENGFTDDILDTLKEYDVPAAFFITGGYIDSVPELVKRMSDEGHIVGNHTDKHPSMPEWEEAALLDDIKKLDDKFFSLTGKNMSYLRPPKGEFSERTLALSERAGYKTVMWSSAYADWDVSSPKGKNYAVEQVCSQFHNGSIILLHAVLSDNAEALPEIIEKARSLGYTFLSLDQL